MNELIKLIEKPSLVNFDHLKISIASPDEIVSWSHGEIKNPKPSTIELLNLKEADYFVQEFLDQSKIMNAYVENIRE